jgi:hypothetical protein
MIDTITMGDVGVPTPPNILRELMDICKFYTQTHSDSRREGRQAVLGQHKTLHFRMTKKQRQWDAKSGVNSEKYFFSFTRRF